MKSKSLPITSVIRPVKTPPRKSRTAGFLWIAALCLLLGHGAPAVATTTNLYTTGSGSWTCPALVTSVQVECWGGGGAGGSANKTNTSSWGGGGAGGAYARRASVPVTPGHSYTYFIGAGGTNTSAINGTRVAGGDTTFTNDSGVTVTAAGGQGGASAIDSGGGAAGTGSSSGCVGDPGAVFAGGSGVAGVSSYGGGGGGGAGNASAGTNAVTSNGGAGGATGGGAGGNGALTGAPGSPGSVPGGGGGGARMTGTAGLQAGGTGGAGQIILTYTAGGCTAATAATPVGNGGGTGGLAFCQGTSITLTETPGAGTPPFSYQWKSNGVPVSGGTASALLISAPINGDQYTCDVTAQCGGPASTSSSVALVVIPPATAPGQPSATTSACNPVTVSWGAVSGASSYNVYRKVSGGSYGSAIANTTGTTYSDSDNTNLLNGSTYVYAVSSLGCGESARSGDSSGVTPTLPPAITSSPASVSTNSGSQATFMVAAVNATSYQWRVNKGSGFVNAVEGTDGTGSTSAIFVTVAATTGMNGYQYQCVASGSCSPAATSGAATLNVANIVNVGTLAALQSAINNAHAGDTIILSNGAYIANSAIAIKCVGTSNAPILIQAQSIGGATIGGN